MNQPTEDRIKRLEEEQRQLKEKVRKLEEQQTEPIRIDRLEIDRGGTHKKLDAVQEDLTVLKDDVGVLKIQMEGARADMLQVRESQADLRDRLIEHGEELKVIKDKQEAHTDVLGQLVNIGEETKTTLAEHGEMLKLILAELKKPKGE